MNRTYKDADDCNTKIRLDKEIVTDLHQNSPTHHTDLYKKVRSQILKTSCFKNVDRIVVGLSGGVDSAVLLFILSEYNKNESGPEILALHVNHHQRGNESDRDESIAKIIAQKLGCPFEAVSIANPVQSMSEDQLRRARHEAFSIFSKKNRAQRIVLAHHMDDQVETFLFRLIRGADVRGLSSMRVFQPPYVRPLLFCRRAELVHEAEHRNLPYIDDSSNFFTGPARNFIRKTLLPAIEAKLDPQVAEHLFDLSLSLEEIDSYMATQAIEIIKKTELKPGEFSIRDLRQIPSVVRKKMFQMVFGYITKDKGSLSRDQIEMIDRWVDTAQSPKFLLLPFDIKVEKSKGVLKFVST